MGYTTYFNGGLTFNKPVEQKLKDYLNEFTSIRHMERDVVKIMQTDKNWKEHCFNGELGKYGAYYLGNDCEDETVVDYNKSGGCPGLWCQWVINTDSKGVDRLEWDGGEKFYHYVEWMRFLINNFFAPSGYILNGDITWVGEDESDLGMIRVIDNKVEVGIGYVAYDFTSEEALERYGIC